MKFYSSVEKVLKVKKFLGLIPTFVEVTGETWWEGGLFGPHPILNRVKDLFSKCEQILRKLTVQCSWGIGHFFMGVTKKPKLYANDLRQRRF